MNDIELFKQKFDIYLEEYLDKKIKNISKFTKDLSILDYLNYIKKISLSEGKRIRPYISYLMYKSLGGKDDKNALKLLVFLEIFHSFCLMHDDIIDKAKLRHGIETSHVYITNKLKKKKRTGDLVHIGNSQAILLGDILLTWSQEILNLSSGFNQDIMQKIKRLFYEMVDEVSVGQMIDVDITTRKKVSKNLIDEKTRLKTAGYSSVKPLLIGAALSGKNTKEVEGFCKEFGLRMGIAFQIQDDLLDITSLDKSQHQHTYFTYFNSLEFGKKIIERNFREAKELVKNYNIEKDYKNKFFNLIEIIERRTS